MLIGSASAFAPDATLTVSMIPTASESVARVPGGAVAYARTPPAGSLRATISSAVAGIESPDQVTVTPAPASARSQSRSRAAGAKAAATCTAVGSGARVHCASAAESARESVRSCTVARVARRGRARDHPREHREGACARGELEAAAEVRR